MAGCGRLLKYTMIFEDRVLQLRVCSMSISTLAIKQLEFIK